MEKYVYLSSPTMHGEELVYMQEAYQTNWMSTVGANINETERITCQKVGARHAVALSPSTMLSMPYSSPAVVEPMGATLVIRLSGT